MNKKLEAGLERVGIHRISILEKLEYLLEDFMELPCPICTKKLDERLQCRGCRREFMLMVERE